MSVTLPYQWRLVRFIHRSAPCFSSLAALQPRRLRLLPIQPLRAVTSRFLICAQLLPLAASSRLISPTFRLNPRPFIPPPPPHLLLPPFLLLTLLLLLQVTLPVPSANARATDGGPSEAAWHRRDKDSFCALCKFVSTPRSACRPPTHPSFVSSAANKRAPHGVEVDGGEDADKTKHRSSLESCQLCRSRLMPAAADRLAKNHAAALMRCSGRVTCTSAACSSGNQGMWGDDTARCRPPAPERVAIQPARARNLLYSSSSTTLVFFLGASPSCASESAACSSPVLPSKASSSCPPRWLLLPELLPPSLSSAFRSLRVARASSFSSEHKHHQTLRNAEAHM